MQIKDTPPSGSDGFDLSSLLRLLRRTLDILRGYFSELLRVKDSDKPKIYFEVFQNAELADLNYWLEIIFSIGIATLGLILSSPAVVIGAMLISPLMGPIFGTGMAIALGDFYLGLKSVINVILSGIVSILLAAAITWILPFHSPTSEILARIQPTLLDLAVAVLSGLAGAIVLCRGGSGGGVTALPGVAVAVALMPPLGVVGFGIGIGWDWNVISGGGLLFLTNLVAIILSSVVVFFSVRLDAPAVRKEITDWLGRQENSDTMYDLVQQGPLRRLFGNLGTLPRRITILLLFLAVVTFPLIRTLNRIVEEANTRRIATHDVEAVIPKESLFREDVEIERGLVRIRVMAILPQGFSDPQRKQLENDIAQQTGRKAEVFVYAVATRGELAEFARRSNRASTEVVETVDELRIKLWLQLRPAVESVWPSDRSPLLNAQISFSEGSPASQIHLVYLADEDLGELGQEAIQKNLRQRIGDKALEISFERISSRWTLSFPRGSAVISTKSRRELEELVLILRRFPETKCSVSISDDTSKPKDALAQERLNAMIKLLSDNQVSVDRVQPGSEHTPTNTAAVRLLSSHH